MIRTASSGVTSLPATAEIQPANISIGDARDKLVEAISKLGIKARVDIVKSNPPELGVSLIGGDRGSLARVREILGRRALPGGGEGMSYMGHGIAYCHA